MVVASCLVAVGIGAQVEQVLAVHEADKTFHHMAETVFANGAQKIADAEIRLERRGVAFRYVAKLETQNVGSHWYSRTSRRPWVVYGSHDGRFHELDSRVRVECDSPKTLSALANSPEVIRSKDYGELGYAILWLRPTANPLAVVQELQADPRVRKAVLQFKRPRQFPQ